MKRYPLLIQLVLYFFSSFSYFLVSSVAFTIKRVQGRSASKQSGRQEIVSTKVVSLSRLI